MTGEENSRQETESPDKNRSVEVPMSHDTKNPVRKPGSELITVLYMIVGLFILIAAFQLYFTIQDLIRTWVSDQFVPVVSAGYYIIVIVVGIWLLHEYIKKQ